VELPGPSLGRVLGDPVDQRRDLLDLLGVDVLDGIDDLQCAFLVDSLLVSTLRR